MLLIDQPHATVDDLHREPGKAELVGGRIVRIMPTGDWPGAVALNIVVAIRGYAKAKGRGHARGDNVGYVVPELPSGRQSFSPYASFYIGGNVQRDMNFVQGPPTFAVEVRSKDGYGPSAEQKLADKRADYFAAGTLVVWDVDSQAQCVNAYRADSPYVKRLFKRGESADAEPALPGWRIPVDDIFELN